MARKKIQTVLIIKLVINPGIKLAMYGWVIEKRWIRKKEKVSDRVTITLSKQNIIQRGAKFFRNLLGMSVSLFNSKASCKSISKSVL